jgi:hypothetical protein
MDRHSISDIGTRLEHLNDLRDLWNDARTSLLNRSYHLNDHEKALVPILDKAITLIDEHLQKDYRSHIYGREINALPPAASIEGGRGTPLRNRKDK